jgi:hypothetical protein
MRADVLKLLDIKSRTRSGSVRRYNFDLPVARRELNVIDRQAYGTVNSHAGRRLLVAGRGAVDAEIHRRIAGHKTRTGHIPGKKYVVLRCVVPVITSGSWCRRPPPESGYWRSQAD